MQSDLGFANSSHVLVAASSYIGGTVGSLFGGLLVRLHVPSKSLQCWLDQYPFSPPTIVSGSLWVFVRNRSQRLIIQDVFGPSGDADLDQTIKL